MRLKQRSWRHHGLGMLQSELTPTLRVHVWHPMLRAPWYYDEPFRAVHDHRFRLHSTVLAGELLDVPYQVILIPDSESATTAENIRRGNTSVWTVVHAKEAARRPDTRDLTSWVCPAFAMPRPGRRMVAGESYTIERGDFHTTVADGIAVTLVHRSDFGDQPARVLGTRAEHGIVAFYPEDLQRQLWDDALALAEEITAGIDL